MRVRARFLASQPKAKRRKKGGANLWYDGVIAGADAQSGTFHVVYDDGEEESGVLAQFLVVLGSECKHDSDDAHENDAPGGVETAQAAIERQAEAMVLGQLLLRGEKKRKLVDEGFNRHVHHDTNLPEWFLDDERKYQGPAGYAMDLPEDMLNTARDKLRAINASSIKKVAEAKARKARRQSRALTKVKKKATQIANKGDLSEREKSKEVEKLELAAEGVMLFSLVEQPLKR